MTEQPLIIAVAPNGARKTKADLKQIPLTPEEIAETAKECLSAGATMIHLHVRNPEDSSHSLSVNHYKAAIEAINTATNHEILIQVTSEAVGIYTPDEQFEMIHTLKPDAVSIGLREIESLNEKTITDHFLKMKDSGTTPQIILYNETDLNKYHDWLSRRVLPSSAYPVLLVIGKATPDGSFDNHFLTQHHTSKIKASSWMVCGFGIQEIETAKLAADLGGHVRMGFENNSLLQDGTEAENNAALLKQITRYVEDKRSIANLEQTTAFMTPQY